MAELQECFTDDSWKQSLQSEIITVLTESGQTQNQALEQVGYYYQCCAPSFCTNTIGINLSIWIP